MSFGRTRQSLINNARSRLLLLLQEQTEIEGVGDDGVGLRSGCTMLSCYSANSRHVYASHSARA